MTLGHGSCGPQPHPTNLAAIPPLTVLHPVASRKSCQCRVTSHVPFFACRARAPPPRRRRRGRGRARRSTHETNEKTRATADFEGRDPTQIIWLYIIGNSVSGQCGYRTVAAVGYVGQTAELQLHCCSRSVGCRVRQAHSEKFGFGFPSALFIAAMRESAHHACTLPVVEVVVEVVRASERIR